MAIALACELLAGCGAGWVAGGYLYDKMTQRSRTERGCQTFANLGVTVAESRGLAAPTDEGTVGLYSPALWRPDNAGQRGLSASIEGTLFVTDRAVLFIGSADEMGIRIPYPTLLEVDLRYRAMGEAPVIALQSCVDRQDVFIVVSSEDRRRADAAANRRAAKDIEDRISGLPKWR
ncbi:MAG: hypothetical protein U1F41_00405 [Burkholderiales bacterium]